MGVSQVKSLVTASVIDIKYSILILLLSNFEFIRVYQL